MIKKNNSFLSFLFLIFISALLSHLAYFSLSNDLKLSVASMFLDVLLILTFLIGIYSLSHAFNFSLLLLPVFFLLENLSTIGQVYQYQTSGGFSFYNFDPRTIGFLLAGFFAILLLRQKKKKITPLIVVLITASLFWFISGFWSVGGTEKYVQISFYFLLISLFFLSFFSIRNIKSLYKLLFSLIVLSLPAVFLSYYQLLGGFFYEYSDMTIHRVSGPFDSPNLLGSFLLITMALALILLFYFHALSVKKYRSLLFFYILLAFPIFLFTFSRSAWLGLIVFIGIFTLQKRKLFIGTVLIFSLIISLALIFEPMQKRLNGFSKRRMFDSMYARTNIWYLSHRKFTEKPFFGYGAGSFATVINDAKESANGTENPHNDLVFFSLEGGLVGLVVFLIVIVTFYYYSFKKHFLIHQALEKNKESNSQKLSSLYILSWGALALIFAISTISMVESYYEGNFLHLFTWSLLAGWLGLKNPDNRVS